MEDSRAGKTPDAPDTWSVRGLADAIGEHLAAAFPSEVWVRGEIHDLHRASSGHVYLTLTESAADRDEPASTPRRGDDGSARLSVMLSSANRQRVNRLLLRAGGRVRMTDGTEVRIRGRLDLYAPRGQLQLLMTSIDPAFTLGQQAMARAQLLERLAAEDLVAANGRCPLPPMALRVGLVTSVGSAAAADVVHELETSGLAFEIVVADVRVQGEGAATQVAQAIADLGGADVDVVVVTRGGGATSDLAAFDTEVVARAIATCPHPVITGIGHEIDRSVADEVAHTAAKTPTAAAQVLVRHVVETHAVTEELWLAIARRAELAVAHAARELAHTERRLGRAVARGVQRADEQLDQSRRRLDRVSASIVTRAEERLAAQAARLPTAARRSLDRTAARLDLFGSRVQALDPARALVRGWSITRHVDGRLIRSAADVSAGDHLHITLAAGTIGATVDTVDAARSPATAPLQDDHAGDDA